jgi:hypothetical protein
VINKCRKGILLAFFLSAPFLFPQSQSNSPEFLISRLIQSLQDQNLLEYYQHFAHDLREEEAASITTLFENFDLEEVTVALISMNRTGEKDAVAHMRSNFRNSYSVIMEIWKLELRLDNAEWFVAEKETVGNPQTMYSVSIPSSRVERVKAVVIQHADIRIAFEDALVFYDNIPEIETALFVMGEGRVDFEPSLEREQHQLELVYKDPYFKEKIEYAFIRCSHSFFSRNINIISYPEETPLSISEEEWTNVSFLFSRHYPRAFTVESPGLDSLLSVLPQGDEAVFDFKTRDKGVFSYIFSPFSDEEISLYEWEETRLICLYSPPLEGSKRRMFIGYGQKYDVKDIQLQLTYQPDDYLFAGSAEIRLESLVGRLGSVKFKFNPDLTILRIQDESGHNLYYTWDRLRKTVYVHLLNEVPRGQTVRIVVAYRGIVPPQPVHADVMMQGAIQDIDGFPLEYRTYLYGRRSFWYPSPATDDYFTAGLTVSIPKEYDILSSGIQTKSVSGRGSERSVPTGFVTIRFESREPLKYLSFIVGRFREITRKEKPIFMTYLHSSRVRTDHWNVLEEAAEILSVYESKFGDYPFENFTILKRAWASGGGYSPPGFIIINELPRGGRFRLRLLSRSPVDFSQWEEYFLAHELAHQWWGQGMSWKSYRDQWLSEGLSQFSASLYLEEKYGPGALSRIIKKFSSWTRRKSEWGSITMGSRISHFDFEAYQAVVYNKAALVLHLLKDYIGEDLFCTGIQKFFSRNKYSPAGTSGFRDIFHSISGLDLNDFFNHWLDSYKLPEVEIRKSIQKTGDEYLLRLYLEQTGLPFVFPLWVEWKESGQKIRQKVLVNKERDQFIFTCKEKPKNIKINRDNAVPGKFRIR